MTALRAFTKISRFTVPPGNRRPERAGKIDWQPLVDLSNRERFRARYPQNNRSGLARILTVFEGGACRLAQCLKLFGINLKLRRAIAWDIEQQMRSASPVIRLEPYAYDLIDTEARRLAGESGIGGEIGGETHRIGIAEQKIPLDAIDRQSKNDAIVQAGETDIVASDTNHVCHRISLLLKRLRTIIAARRDGKGGIQ